MKPDDPRYFFIFFVLLWVVVGFIVAQISGWAELSRCYRSGNPFEGRRWNFRSGRMRLNMAYNNCLTIGADSEGLYLAVFFLFRSGHPPLFIPWQDISVKTGKTFLWKWKEFRFRQAPRVYLKIFGRLSDDIESVAGAFWQGEKAFG